MAKIEKIPVSPPKKKGFIGDEADADRSVVVVCVCVSWRHGGGLEREELSALRPCGDFEGT